MRVCCYLLPILCFSAASAADKDGSFAVRNAGMMTCAAFVEEMQSRSDRLNLFMGWIDGYVTAANQFTDDTFDVVPWGNTVFLATLLENHCRSNSEQRFYLAVNQLVGALLPHRIAAQTELVETRHDDSTTYLYRTVLEQVQAQLIELDFLNSVPSGEFNDATRRALEEFQSARELRVTGLPDQLTLYSLFGGMGITE